MSDKLVNIIEKSSKMFLEFGIRSVSMDDISREMGMSKKTLYQFVDNKSDLIEKILEYESCKRFDEISEGFEKNMNAIDILITVSISMSKMFKDFNPGMNFDLQKYYPEIFKSHTQKKKENVLIQIGKNLELGIKQGIYREDLDIELVSSLYIQKIKDIHDPEFFGKEKFTFEKVFEVMFENHIRGIANEVGIKYFEEKKKNIQFKNNEND